jgi:N-acetylmuramoyl-L-alanine amidase
MTIENADPHAHARTANSFSADLYVGVSNASTNATQFAYYETESFVSAGGRMAAELFAEFVRSSQSNHDVVACGMQLPVLRETRMPAVMCTVGLIGNDDSALGMIPALAKAITQWNNQPI